MILLLRKLPETPNKSAVLTGELRRQLRRRPALGPWPGVDVSVAVAVGVAAEAVGVAAEAAYPAASVGCTMRMHFAGFYCRADASFRPLGA